MKGECLLPNTIGKMINENKCDVKVLTTSAKWFGVTYPEDRPDTVAKIEKLIKDGVYPEKLF